MNLLLLLACLRVTPSPGWSDPVAVTNAEAFYNYQQFIHMDEFGRFHLVWSGYDGSSRIGYKMFDLDGTTLFPDTMISQDTNSGYVSTTTKGDSLFAFWREYDPVYYAIRSLSDGSEITPATCLFTTYTMYGYIRACPDSLGRLHVLYNDGSDIIYSVWNPAPGSGFITEYEWMIEGVIAGGVLLVDGDRVHVVVQDTLNWDFSYLQYDLEGNTVVPLTDFTLSGPLNVSRFPELEVDSNRNLLVIEEASYFWKSDKAFYLWKLNGETGELMIEQKALVWPQIPDMDTSKSFVVGPILDTDHFYLCWTDGYYENKIYNMVFDSDGEVVLDWHIAYDYTDEDPEDLDEMDGAVDDAGNLYVVYSQIETEPQSGYFPTFGWFDYDYLGIAEGGSRPVRSGFSFSRNPVRGSVTVHVPGMSSGLLRVYDLAGREVSSVKVTDGSGVWYGRDARGERLPAGVYTVVAPGGDARRLTLLSD